MPCGRLYGLSVGEERIHFHRAEIPIRQHPHELPSARALFSLDTAIPSPATALAVAPSLMVIARVEPPTPARRAIAPAQAPTASGAT